MDKKTQQISRAIQEKKFEKEREAEANKIATKIKSELDSSFQKIVAGFELLAEHLKEINNRIDKKDIKLPDTFDVSGKVEIKNTEDLKKDIQKVEVLNPIEEVRVKNQIDLGVLREDLNQILLATNQIVGEEHFKNEKTIVELRDFLSKLLIKQDSELLVALRPLRYLSNDPQKPLSVRLSDGDKFYRAIEQVVYSAAGQGADMSEVITLLEEILEALGGATAGDLKQDWSSQTCVPATEKLLAILTATAGKGLVVKGIVCEGIDDGLFKLYVNGNCKWQWRNAWTERGGTFNYEARVPSGQAVELKATNLRLINRILSGGIYGYEL